LLKISKSQWQKDKNSNISVAYFLNKEPPTFFYEEILQQPTSFQYIQKNAKF